MVHHKLMSGESERAGQPLRPHEARYLDYLSFWARFIVRRRKPLVIGITGSVGKTTTREIVAAVLKAASAVPGVGVTWATPRNMNNNFGVPLTLLGYRHWRPRRDLETLRGLTIPFRALRKATRGAYPDILVLEFAAGPTSDTERTVALAPPDIGIVTAIGPAHLDTFGTLEKIAEVKGAVVRAVPPSGLVILGADNALASEMDRYAKAPVVKVPGKGQSFAEAAARVIADRLGIPADLADRALAERGQIRGRQEVIRVGEGTVMNDSFNANPLSMEHGLETLAERARPDQRRVAVMGHMAEIGPDGPQYHRDMAPVARRCADLVVGVGELARLYEPDLWFGTSKECADAVASFAQPGDYVLVKGSHSSHLGIVVNAVQRQLKGESARA